MNLADYITDVDVRNRLIHGQLKDEDPIVRQAVTQVGVYDRYMREKKQKQIKLQLQNEIDEGIRVWKD